MTGEDKAKALRASTITGILKLLRMTYQGYYRGDSDKEQRDQLGVWLMFFGDLEPDDFRLFEAAVVAYIDNNTTGFPPTPGQIRGWMKDLKRAAFQDGEDDLWQLVRKAAGAGPYGIKDAYASLPEDAQNAIGSPAGLRELSQTSADQLSYAEHRFKEKLKDLRSRREMQENATRAFKLADSLQRIGIRNSERAYSAYGPQIGKN